MSSPGTAPARRPRSARGSCRGACHPCVPSIEPLSPSLPRRGRTGIYMAPGSEAGQCGGQGQEYDIFVSGLSSGIRNPGCPGLTPCAATFELCDLGQLT